MDLDRSETGAGLHVTVLRFADFQCLNRDIFVDKAGARINLGSISPQLKKDANCLACAPDMDGLLKGAPALAPLWNSLPRKALRKGQVLVQIGQNVKQVWRVESGLLRMVFLSPQGVERNRSFHAEGHWLGAGSPPIEANSPYVIEALENSTLVEIPYALLQQVTASHPQALAVLQDALTATFAQQNQRLADLLMLNATERYCAFLEFYGALAERLPLHHVASYLGITNVALSRIRRRGKAVRE